MLKPDRVVTTDVFIIGSEGAGARAAIAAAEKGLAVLVATKGKVTRSGATLCAPGDYSVNSRSACRLGLNGDQRDSSEEHVRDTMAGGKQINDPVLSRIMCEEAFPRLAELNRYGVPWTKLFHYPGHTYPRGAAVGLVGKTGVSMTRALNGQAKKAGATIYSMLMVLSILTESPSGRACAATAIDMQTGESVVVKFKVAILCTGGGGRLYAFTTTPEEATGEGIVLAYQAGAELVDLEFVQFIPYAFVHPPAVKGNNYFAIELVSLLEAPVLNRHGERFMQKVDPVKMEKATRDIFSRACAREILEGRGGKHGGVYVDLTVFPPEKLEGFAEELFPGWKIGAIRLTDFLDVKKEYMEIAPAAHFFMGGVRIDRFCRTTVPGLYAAGEVVGGIHGANRISGNALTETQVFGKIAGDSAAAEARALHSCPDPDPSDINQAFSEAFDLLGKTGDVSIYPMRETLRERCYKYIGPVRSGNSLKRFLDRELLEHDAALAHVGIRSKGRIMNMEWRTAIETKMMLDLARLIGHAALSRNESRGAHFREDAEEMSQDPYNTLIRRDASGKPSIAPCRLGREP
jgi:succinate dehydrogenase/fumarate reductase flavoprotein subunit